MNKKFKVEYYNKDPFPHLEITSSQTFPFEASDHSSVYHAYYTSFGMEVDKLVGRIFAPSIPEALELFWKLCNALDDGSSDA